MLGTLVPKMSDGTKNVSWYQKFQMVPKMSDGWYLTCQMVPKDI